MSVLYDDIFEGLIDGIHAFESGLVNAALYILEDTLIKTDQFYEENGIHHESRINIQMQLAKVYIWLRQFQKAVDILKSALESSPENVPVLYRLFLLYSDAYPNEKMALKVYLRAESVMKENGSLDCNHRIYKNFVTRGEKIKCKRQSFFMFKDDTEEIDKQNLMKQLPIEILSNIFSMLDPKSLINLLLTCKGWRSTILESPHLIGAFTLSRDITFKKLQSYLRLFDQKVSTSEIILDELSIAFNSRDELPLMKLLLSSGLRSKSLNIEIREAIQPQICTLIKESKPLLFTQQTHLSITIEKEAQSISFVDNILPMMTNLQTLYISFRNLSSPKQKSSSPLIDLPRLRFLNIKNEGKHDQVERFVFALTIHNVESLTIDTRSTNIFLKCIRTANKLKHLKMRMIPIELFLYDFMIEGRPGYERVKELETLEFDTCPSSVDHIFGPRVQFKEFNNLRVLKFRNSQITVTTIEAFFKTCKKSLKELDVLEKSLLSYKGSNTNNNGTFSLKNVLETCTGLEELHITDNKINSSNFTQIAFDIAMLTRPMKLNCLELSNSSIPSSSYIVLFLSIKTKLTIKRMIIHQQNPDVQLISFSEELKRSKVVGEFCFI